MNEVHDRPGVDDPIWPYVLSQRLMPYIPFVREWWLHVAEYEPPGTGMEELVNTIPGLYIRFTRTAVRSPIHNVQTFPFTPTARLQLSGIQGGANKMVERVCLNNKFKIEEFTIICKSNLPSIFGAGQIVAFVPTDILENTEKLGRWLYFTKEEIEALACEHVPLTVINKALLKL